MPARAYSRGIASYKVTQYLPHGEKVTYVCTDDMAAMSKVLTDADTIEVL